MEKIVAANMKMNMTAYEVNEYLKVINEKVNSDNVILCPTSIYIPYFLKQNYQVGIQNVFFQESGAYTGEVSPLQARSLGINYAIIGHSERRTYFDEKDADINNKVLSCIKNGLKVILCVGETKEEKDLLKTEKVLKKQLTTDLKNLELKDLENIVIAYEPLWSIGSGLTPTNEEILSTVYFIKSTIMGMYDITDIKVLYGGSVNEKNIDLLNQIENVNGFLVGGASLNPDKILKIIDSTLNK